MSLRCFSREKHSACECFRGLSISKQGYSENKPKHRALRKPLGVSASLRHVDSLARDTDSIDSWLCGGNLGKTIARAVDRAVARKNDVDSPLGLVYRTPLARRDVAQSGSALEWGSRGRRFKSFHPDHLAHETGPGFRPGPDCETPSRSGPHSSVGRAHPW